MSSPILSLYVSYRLPADSSVSVVVSLCPRTPTAEEAVHEVGPGWERIHRQGGVLADSSDSKQPASIKNDCYL